ncbi:polysaccharide deacetylase family protein [Clostridium algidicarnis]|uniref:polysaccharide deacetylase family protein n=1 Tax=Clostridium algidicarnis TaxID=37659 RepID=UPI001C0C85A3|nr:polysaccharide deacetylase family protein [Clostridium algidicarnis]MBU3202560.1 polysaccharide deacetylase [Clostridium algidicarnis]MBU3210714.1 polysaccharide deacetylase [Clostridium algidicarnis]MBU3222778.1 polysaccharide deacetylase [Clostridium algidicarnis]
MSITDHRNQKPILKKNKKLNNKNLAISILVLSILIIGIIAGQFIINKYGENDSTVSASEETKSPDIGKPSKKGKEKIEEKELAYKNTSIKGQDKIDSATIAKDAINGKAIKDGKKVIYLTFDDGPSTTVTPQILNILKSEDVKATFFILGKSLSSDGVTINEKSGEVLKQEYDDGHAIANHTYSHDYKYLYPSKNINMTRVLEDIEKNNVLIKEVIGESFETTVVRFPGGLMSWKGQDVAIEKLKEKNIVPVDWNALNGDAESKKRKPEELIEKAISTSKNKDKVVMLMHDTYGKETTAEALTKIIQHFKNEGYEFRTLN